MKTKFMKCLAFGVMVMSLGLCFAGCDLLNKNDDSKNNPADTGQDSGQGQKESITYTLDDNFKTTYYVGEDLDYEHAYVHYTENGQEKKLKLTGLDFAGFDTSTVGTYSIYVRVDYDDVFTLLPLTYTVIDYDVVEVVELKGMTYDFYQNDYISFAGVKAVLKLSNNTTTEIKVDSNMFTNLSTETVGKNKTFTFTYKGISKNFNYSVEKNTYDIIGVEGLEVNYALGDSIDLSKAQVKYIKNGQLTTYCSIYEGNITNFSTATVGRRTMSIKLPELDMTYTLDYRVYQLNDLLENKLYYYQCNDSNGKYIYLYVNGLSKDSAEIYIGFSSANPSTVNANPGAVSTTRLKHFNVAKSKLFSSNSYYYDTSRSSGGTIQVNGYKFIISLMDVAGSACTVSYYSSLENSSPTSTYRLYEF